MWESSPGDGWVVGGFGTILRWNGSVMSSVASGTSQNLWGVWGSGPNDVWAVGDNGTILRWQASAITQMSPP
jgi:photosystem II stability/assembly factor-like uncharacterized protein